MMNMEAYVEKVLVTEAEINKKTAELGAQISKDFEGQELLLVSVLKGGFMFAADLIRKITIPVKMDFIAVSSYGSGTETSGTVNIKKDLDCDIKGKNVLIAEDIIDSGITLSHLKKLFLDRGAKCVKICTILSKPSRRKTELDVEYIGFEIPDEYVIGYGLDYDERFRSLPYVGVLKRSVYEK